MYNLLIVDDEQKCIDAIKENIEWTRLEIRQIYEACSAKQARNILKTYQIPLVLCDIEMPEEGGLELAKWITDEGMEPAVIFVTCHPEFSYAQQALRLKCFDYVLKPVDYDELTGILFSAIRWLENEKLSSTSQPITVKSAEDGGWNKGLDSEKRIEYQIKDYVKEHLSQSISIQEIAEELKFSPTHIMRTFKQKTGMSILDYITETRLETAKKILTESDIPIRTVADMVGYDDYSYFTRIFKKQIGEPPLQYRKRKREQI